MVHVSASGVTHSHRKAAAALFIFVVIPAAAAGFYFGYNVGTLTVLVTDDAVRDFDWLNITFSKVEVHGAGALTPSEWVTVSLSTRTIDLTRLADNATSVLGLDKVTAGRYSQLRLTVDSARGGLKGGGSVNVTVPSGELKTETPFELKPQGALTLTVRLQVTAAGGGYTLRPAFGGIDTP